MSNNGEMRFRVLPAVVKSELETRAPADGS
jgi:hypothetical protein